MEPQYAESGADSALSLKFHEFVKSFFFFLILTIFFYKLSYGIC